MSLSSQARAVLDQIAGLISAASVQVVHGGQTATGIRHTRANEAALTDEGERGLETETVHVELADLSEPPRGAMIKVDGEDVIVLEVRRDPGEALMAIRYQVTRPVSVDVGDV